MTYEEIKLNQLIENVMTDLDELKYEINKSISIDNKNERLKKNESKIS